MDFVGFYWVSLGLTGCCWVLLGFYWFLIVCIGVH